MSRTTQRTINLVLVIAPLGALAIAVVALWGSAVGPRDLALFAVMYVTTILGITVGFHRFLTHRAFGTSRAFGYVLAVMGTMAAQGPLATWVSGHRKHHANTDVEGDPHSPHVDVEPGLWGAWRATWHAHAGWLFSSKDRADRARFAPELLEDRGFRAIDALYWPIVVLGLALPAAAGWALGGGALHAAVTGLLWGGVLRMVTLWHVTGSVNSLAHNVGSRRFDLADESTNVAWLALPTFGEAWHHNHHAFPRSAAHGLRASEPDPSAWVITGLERVGLVHDVVRIDPERQASREVMLAGP